MERTRYETAFVIHSAITRQNNLKKFTLILNRFPSVIDKPCKYGMTALHTAIMVAKPEFLRLLLARGADTGIPDHYGRCALHCAALWGNIEAAKILISAGDNIDRQDHSPHGSTALHYAVQGQKVQMICWLLRHGASANISNDAGMPLLVAARSYRRDTSSEYKAILEAFLQRGCDVNAPGDRYGHTPFHACITKCDRDMISLLINKYHADITTTGASGDTALHKVMNNPHPEVFKMILDSGMIAIDAKNARGKTPLHHANLSTSEEYIRQLVARGADVNATDRYNRTPLCSIITNFVIIADDRTRSPSQNAINQRLQKIILFLELGSDPNQKLTADNKTIAELAIEKRDWKVVQLIIEHVVKAEARTNKQLLDEFNVEVIKSHPESRALYEKCTTEIEDMKIRRIDGTRVSYFSMFTEPIDVVAMYVRNQELVQAFESSDYKMTFPTFHAQLKAKFDTAIERQKSLERAATTLNRIFGFADPSHLVYDKILSYLSREDIAIINSDQNVNILAM